jgi:hypothetical protein
VCCRNVHLTIHERGMTTKTPTAVIEKPTKRQSRHERTIEARKVADLPLVCTACGNKDWRRFRYHSRQIYGKPPELFGCCQKCGQLYAFRTGVWVYCGTQRISAME